MLLEIVKIISRNITINATFVGCAFGKIPANESHHCEEAASKPKKKFSTLSFGERGQNTSDTVSDASAGAIVLPMKVVHPSFQTKVIYTKSSGSSLLFHPTACKTLNQITMLLHLICQFMNWTSSMCQTFLFKSGYLV